jgi:hypothetical protein
MAGPFRDDPPAGRTTTHHLCGRGRAVHRFGRSGQLKKDRWGGSFILIAGLALAAAYFTGDYLNKYLWSDKTSKVEQGSDLGADLGGSFTPVANVEPKEFTLYTVQVGAFKSPTSAQNQAQKLNEKGYVGFANISTSGMSFAYAGGVFTEKQAAQDYLKGLQEAKVVDAGFVATMKVPYGPEAITAMAGESKSKVESGYSSLNTYLHEVAIWIEEKTAGKNVDATDTVTLGKSLTGIADQIEKANLTDAKMKQLVSVAREAGKHAVTLEGAAKADKKSAEYMKALNEYVSLLAKYNSLQANTTAANQ